MEHKEDNAESQHEQSEGSYLFDARSAAIMAQLLDQSLLFIENMGGLFPERSDLAGIQEILDLASGPGGWVQEVALAYPEVEVTGVDTNPKMVAYGRAQAQVRDLHNVHFQTMDILEPFDFPDETFDMVNASTLVSTVQRNYFPQLWQECKRVLRPGGTLRWTELEWGWASTPAVEQIHILHHKVMHLAGYGFSPSGHFLAVSNEMKPQLRAAGFEQVQHRVELSDVSYGTKRHRGSYENGQMLFTFLQPSLLAHKLVTQDEYERLYERAMLEMQQKNFHCTGFFLTVWGTKPG